MAENLNLRKRPLHQRSKSAVVRSILSSRSNGIAQEDSESHLHKHKNSHKFTIYDQVAELGNPKVEMAEQPVATTKRDNRTGRELTSQLTGKHQPELENRRGRSKSITSMFSRARSKSRLPEKSVGDELAPESSIHKEPTNTRSRTNLAALLRRPKSYVDDSTIDRIGKENQAPIDTATYAPIWAQFTGTADSAGTAAMESKLISCDPPAPSARAQRPKSLYHATSSSDTKFGHRVDRGSRPPSTRSGGSVSTASNIDPSILDYQFEELLSRRNIPGPVREQMKTIEPALKAEFLKSAEGESDSRPGTADLLNARADLRKPVGTELGPIVAETKVPKKSTRPKSWTLGLTLSGDRSTTATRKRGQPSDGPSDTSSPIKSGLKSSEKLGVGIIGKSRVVSPQEFVTYMSQNRAPAAIEVGRLHKLRVLLRNESVDWVDQFMQLGGMDALVDLLYRIIAIEWREEHDDRVMHEALLCIKGVCTTEFGQQRLTSIASIFFPKFLTLIFDRDRKGPSEFTTRGILFGLLLTYLSSTEPTTRAERAYSIFAFLNDTSFDNQPAHAFITDMRSSRPFKTWCKEITNVTKEVFWIFMHSLTVLPAPGTDALATDTDAVSYQKVHFPRERIIVPAQPYVGGVEWDATNYLADHLDLLNAVLACLPSRKERNAMRSDLEVSGFEQLMGKTLRTCKEKLYPSVHEALKTWIAAATDDNWDTKLVRQGPPRAEKASKSHSKDAPRIEKAAIPRVDLSDLRF